MTDNTFRLISTDVEKDIRLDCYLATDDRIKSRAQAQRAIKDRQVTVNDNYVKSSYQIQSGDIIEVRLSDPVTIDVIPEPISLEILYEDADVIVINKPAGMVVHPGAGNSNGTLVNALLYHCKNLSGIGGKIRPGIVHRLDKGTTGVMVAAKNDLAHIHLSRQFEKHSIQREYRALVYGNMEVLSGTVNQPIGRHTLDRKKMSTKSRQGRNAITHWKVLERFKQLTLLKAWLETGRTHQVRVHLASLDHPIVNDLNYGTVKRLRMITDKKILDAVKGLDRPLLHAGFLEFVHPSSEQAMTFKAPLPADFNGILDILRKTND